MTHKMVLRFIFALTFIHALSVPVVSSPFKGPEGHKIALETDSERQTTPKMGNLSNLPGQTHHSLTTLSGIQMPKLIYGTASKKERTAELVVTAVRAGFRGIDTACLPMNYFEPGVGAALKILAMEHGIPRENLFIQTKFTPVHGQDPNNIPYNKTADLTTQVKESLGISLTNLGTTYIDSLILHAPMRSHEQNMQVWRTFESFVDAGKVRQLGVSNFYNVSIFKKLFDEPRVKPAVIQNRFSRDSGYDQELRDFCNKNKVVYQSFGTLTANNDVLRSPKVFELEKKYGKTPAQLLFAYLIGIGFAPLTGTRDKVHMKQDLEALDMTLTVEENKMFDNFFK